LLVAIPLGPLSWLIALVNFWKWTDWATREHWLPWPFALLASLQLVTGAVGAAFAYAEARRRISRAASIVAFLVMTIGVLGALGAIAGVWLSWLFSDGLGTMGRPI
jgi:H+/Cl- antiporter ClcA